MRGRSAFTPWRGMTTVDSAKRATRCVALLLILGVGIGGAVLWLIRSRDSAKREKELRKAGVTFGYLETDRLLSSGELAFVEVRNKDFGDASVPLLSSFRRVRALDVSDTALTGDGLTELLNGRNKSLTGLGVSGLRLDPRVAAAVGRQTYLRSLAAAHCELTDDDAMKMLSPKILFLALDNNQLTDATLGKLSDLPELVVVSLENNQFSEVAIEQFRQQHENIQILEGKDMKDFLRGKWIR